MGIHLQHYQAATLALLVPVSLPDVILIRLWQVCVWDRPFDCDFSHPSFQIHPRSGPEA
jgi:hypothetical protein